MLHPACFASRVGESEVVLHRGACHRAASLRGACLRGACLRAARLRGDLLCSAPGDPDLEVHPREDEDLRREGGIRAIALRGDRTREKPRNYPPFHYGMSHCLLRGTSRNS